MIINMLQTFSDNVEINKSALSSRVVFTANFLNNVTYFADTLQEIKLENYLEQ